MLRSVLPIALAGMILSACAPQPAPSPSAEQLTITEDLLSAMGDLVLLQLQASGREADASQLAAWRAQAASFLKTGHLTPVAACPRNQVISPLTGQPCLFVTTEGPTEAGLRLLRIAARLAH